jgi:hypothetical protein
MEGGSVLEFGGQGVYKIQQAGVDGFDFIGPMVAQDIIYLCQGFVSIMPLAIKTYIKTFLGVGIVEGQIFFGCQDSINRCQYWSWKKTVYSGHRSIKKKSAAIQPALYCPESTLGALCHLHPPYHIRYSLAAVLSMFTI